MNKHRKGLYIIAGLFYLFFSGALALYPTKMTVGATVSMIAGAVLTLIAAIASFVLAAGHIAVAVVMLKNNMALVRRKKVLYAVLAAMTGNPASIFVSGAFARERADGECKKLRKAGLAELIVGAVIIVAAYLITNLTLPSDAFRAATDWIFFCLTLVNDMGLALIAVSTPNDKKKRRKKK